MQHIHIYKKTQELYTCFNIDIKKKYATCFFVGLGLAVFICFFTAVPSSGTVKQMKHGEGVFVGGKRVL